MSDVQPCGTDDQEPYITFQDLIHTFQVVLGLDTVFRHVSVQLKNCWWHDWTTATPHNFCQQTN